MILLHPYASEIVDEGIIGLDESLLDQFSNLDLQLYKVSHALLFSLFVSDLSLMFSEDDDVDAFAIDVIVSDHLAS